MNSGETERTKIRASGPRLQVEQERRDQILRAANDQFRHYGYHKTTVADIAKAIHLSTAYLYNFFESKRSIGEAVCTDALNRITSELSERVRAIESPNERIRFIFSYLSEQSTQLYFHDRKLHDIIALSFQEKWTSPAFYYAALLAIFRDVVTNGRELGQFERKTPLKETCEAIRYTAEPFFHPVLLEQNPRRLSDEASAVADLVLRSLVS